MGYRDETLALRERLLEMEPKFAKLSGRSAGLRMRKSLLEEENVKLLKEVDWRRKIDAAKFRTGLLIAFAVLIGGCLASGFLFLQLIRIDEEMTFSRVTSGERDLGNGQVHIIESVLGECSAELSWATQRVSIKGDCASVHGVSFWGESKEGTFVLSTNTRQGAKGVFRDKDSVVIFQNDFVFAKVNTDEASKELWGR